MEEQKQNIEYTLEVQKNFLDSIFNPAQFKILYPSEPKEEDFLNKEKQGYEQNTYNEIVDGLESDLQNLGMEITYSARIIIREIAMNILFLQRIKGHILCSNLIKDKRVLKQTFISYRQEYLSSNARKTKSIDYDWYPAHDEEIDPVIGKLLPRLQKQIHDGLKDLALLPCQQIERQKLTIVKKLKERFTALNGSEITIEAKAEKEIIRNKKEMPHEQINIENLT
jgi:hypothetical protein